MMTGEGTYGTLAIDSHGNVHLINRTGEVGDDGEIVRMKGAQGLDEDKVIPLSKGTDVYVIPRKDLENATDEQLDEFAEEITKRTETPVEDGTANGQSGKIRLTPGGIKDKLKKARDAYSIDQQHGSGPAGLTEVDDYIKQIDEAKKAEEHKPAGENGDVGFHPAVPAPQSSETALAVPAQGIAIKKKTADGGLLVDVLDNHNKLIRVERFDAKGRLTIRAEYKQSRDGKRDLLTKHTEYGYDRKGRRYVKHETNFTYDKNDRLTRSEKYGFDAHGRKVLEEATTYIFEKVGVSPKDEATKREVIKLNPDGSKVITYEEYGGETRSWQPVEEFSEPPSSNRRTLPPVPSQLSSSAGLDRPTQLILDVKFLEVTHKAAQDLGIPWTSAAGQPVAGAPSGKKASRESVERGYDTLALVLGSDAPPKAAKAPPSSQLLELATLAQGAPATRGIEEAARQQDGVRVLAEASFEPAAGAVSTLRLGGDLEIPAKGGQREARFEGFGVTASIGAQVSRDRSTVQIQWNDSVDSLERHTGNAFLGTPSSFERVTHTHAFQVAVAPNGTLLIGNLFPDDDEEMPWDFPALAHLPTLGPLYASQDFRKGESQLVAMVTPRVAAARRLLPEAVQVPQPQILIEPRVIESSGSADKALGYPSPEIKDCLDDSQLRTVSLGEVPGFVESVVKNQSEGMLGGLFGGSLGSGFAGGGSGSFGPGTPMSGGSSSATALDRNTVKGLPSARVEFPGGPSFDLQALKDGPGMTLGIHIDPKALKDRHLLFSNAYLLDPQCQEHQPSGRFVFEIWQDRKFSFHIELWRWRDGQLVEHWSRSGSKEWSERLASGAFPIWLGARFDGLTPERLAEGGWSLVTTWSYEKGRNAYLQPLVFDFSGNAEAATTAVSKVPALAGVPVLGELFRGKPTSNAQRELVVFVTPRIVSE